MKTRKLVFNDKYLYTGGAVNIEVIHTGFVFPWFDSGAGFKKRK